MILIIDNYDSFTYNIFQYIGEINSQVTVIKNDLLSIENIKKEQYTHIIISPGPGGPNESGRCIEIVKRFYKKILIKIPIYSLLTHGGPWAHGPGP